MSLALRRWWRPRRIVLVLLASLLLVGFLARQHWLPALAHFLDVSGPPQRVTAMMVLGGGANDRPFMAAALVRAGLAERVLVPTVKILDEGEDVPAPPEHELIRRVLLNRGIAPERIIQLPGECASTQDEARAWPISWSKSLRLPSPSSPMPITRDAHASSFIAFSANDHPKFALWPRPPKRFPPTIGGRAKKVSSPMLSSTPSCSCMSCTWDCFAYAA